MTRIAANTHRSPRVETRLLLDPEDHADLCAIAKVSGLAASQLARSIIKDYLNNVYGSKDQTT